MTQKRIVINVNTDWFFLSHRLEIAKVAISRGYEVSVFAKDTGCRSQIESFGIHFYNLNYERRKVNLFIDVFDILRIIILFWKIKPSVIHNVTWKPIVFGSIAARILGYSCVVNAVAGLGHMFTNGRDTRLSRLLLFSILRLSGFTRFYSILQNMDDLSYFVRSGLLIENKCFLIRGSGVDLNKFEFYPNIVNGRLRILFSSRLMYDKGIDDLRKATEILKNSYKDDLTFLIAGRTDVHNKSVVSLDYFDDWIDGDYVSFIGHQEDINEVLRSVNVVVLPSFYREGIPKALIEACATGRVIITTDSVGCRECVDNEKNGFLIPIKSPDILANTIKKILHCTQETVSNMGMESRLKAEREFDLKFVVEEHMRIYDTIS